MNQLELRRRLLIQEQITKIDVGTHILNEGLRSITSDLNPILKSQAIRLQKQIIQFRDNVSTTIGKEIGIS